MTIAMTDTAAKIKELGPWFHNIHLPDGSQTAPDHFLGDFPLFKWKEIGPALPQDLTGKKVLDIGCNAGFYSIELAKRGADVLAIDLDPHYLQQAKWVTAEFGLSHRIFFEQMQVYDLTRLDEEFDIVWFMGVFYHLRYPLLALDIIAEKSRDTLIFQTLSLPEEEVFATPDNLDINDRKQMLEKGWPKMAFIENSLASDPTNWWAPNKACIEAMLRTCGFEIESTPGHELYVCKKDQKLSSVTKGWNKSEFNSAIGKDWHESLESKVRR